MTVQIGKIPYQVFRDHVKRSKGDTIPLWEELSSEVQAVWSKAEKTSQKSPDIGQTAYEAYLAQARGRAFNNGELLQPWERLDPAIKTAWVKVDEAVRASCG